MLEISTLQLLPDGTPFSGRYGDVYHSAAGGLAQARHVFLGGNDLPERWWEKPRFVILETGFGLGLNFLATWQAWCADPSACRELVFISLEKHPFAADDLAAAHAAWPELSALSEALRGQWPPLQAGEHRLRLEMGAERRVELRLLFGDAAALLPAAVPTLGGIVDAFYLDGFSPAKNPALWSPELCRALARLAKPDATLATWSVAGDVRRALTAAGFVVEKRPGFADKRQMLVGRLCANSAPVRLPSP